MAKIITWNDIPSTSIPELVVESINRQMIGVQRGVHVEIDGKPGSYFFPQEPGRRLIVAECRVLVADMADRADVLEQVADWLAVYQEAQLKFSDRPGRYYLATLEAIPTPREWRHLAKFDLEWSAQPYAYEEDITEEVFAAGLDTTHTWNPGMVTNAYPVIEIEPTDGTLSSFNLESVAGNLNWYGYTIASGEKITINSISPVIVAGASTDINLTGVYDPTQVYMFGMLGTFPILIPSGSNFIRFEKIGGTATTFEVTVRYRKQYRR